MARPSDRPWLLPFLAQIRPRPGMYLGHENTRLLWEYLMGYCQARRDIGVSAFGEGEADHLQRFTAWLRARHGHERAGCCDIIEGLDPTPRNLATFFRAFDAYLVEAGIDPTRIRPRLPTGWAMAPGTRTQAGTSADGPAMSRSARPADVE